MDVSISKNENSNTSKAQLESLPGRNLKLRDYMSMSQLIDLIPSKAQKGLTVLNVELTCLDVASDYIALGSNVGVIFLYNRESQILQRLRCKPNSAITVVKMLSSVDFLIAAGTIHGLVTVFRLPSTLPGRNKEMEQFTINDLHRNAVTCLEWSSNGMKLFSGDFGGIVVYTEIDVNEHVSRSEILLSESHEIVQMSYKHMVLLISTLRRALLCKMDEDNRILQVGQKDRKGIGRFGVQFTKDLCKPQDIQLYSVRPGLRIWRANVDGVVLETLIFKEILQNRTTENSESNATPTFGFLLPYDEDLLITWVYEALYIIDPSRSLVLDSYLNIQKIHNLAIYKDEIFILKGPREVIRIGQKRDPYSPSKRAIDILATVTPPSSPRRSILEKVTDRTNLLPKAGSQSPINFLIQKIKSSTEGNETKSKSDKSVTRKNAQNLENDDILAVLSPELEDKSSSSLPPIVRIESDEIVKLETSLSQPPMLSQPPEMTPDIYTSDDMHSDNLQKANSSPNDQKAKTPEVPNVFDRFSAVSNEEFQDIVYQKPTKKKRRKPKDSSKLHTDTSSIHSDSSSCTASPERSVRSQNCDNASLSNTSLSYASDFSAKNIPVVQIHSQDSLGSDAQNYLGPLSVSNLEVNNETISDEILESSKLIDSGPQSFVDSGPQSFVDSGPQSFVDNGLQTVLDSRQQAWVDMDQTENKDLKSEIDIRPHSDSGWHNLKRTSVDHDPLISSPDDIYNQYQSSIKDSHSEFSIATHKSDSLSSSSDKMVHEKSNKPELKYMDIWSEYNLPGILIGFTISEKYAVCCDSKEQVYYSTTGGFGVHWEKLDYCARQVSISPSGSIIWRVHRNSLFAAKEPGIKSPTASSWFEAAKDVAFATVDDRSGWFIKITGEILMQKNLTRKRPCFKSIKIDCPWRLRHISCCRGVVWAVTTENKLIFRLGVTEDDPEGAGWAEVGSEVPIAIMVTSFGPKNTGWIVDTSGRIWFRTGVMLRTPQGEDHLWWQVETRSVIMPELATSTLKSWADTLNPAEMFSSLVSSQQGFIIAAGSSGIWFYEGPKTTIQVSKSSLIGHRWEHIKPQGMAPATKWSIVCASAATETEGLIWSVQPNTDAFFFTPTNRRFMEVDLPPKNTFKCLSGSVDGIWGLTSEGEIYIRSGMSLHCPQGVAWQILDLRQLGNIKLIHLSCGHESVWAVDVFGNIYLRLGSLKAPKSQSLPPAWILVDGKPQYGNYFVLIESGPTDLLVWAIDNKKNVYVRDGISPNLPIGNGWVHIVGVQAQHLAISRDKVWAVSITGEVIERIGITEKDLGGQYWKKLPGHSSFLTVSQNGNLFSLSKENLLHGHSSRCYIQRMHDEVNGNNSVSQKTSEDGEWEFL